MPSPNTKVCVTKEQNRPEEVCWENNQGKGQAHAHDHDGSTEHQPSLQPTIAKLGT